MAAPALAAVNAALRQSDGARPVGVDELQIRCLEPHRHQNGDAHPSATWNVEKGAGKCHGCGATWSTREAARLLAVAPIPTAETGRAPRAAEQKWDVRDADGRIVATHTRIDRPTGKTVYWSRPGVPKGLGDMSTADLPLYACHLLGTREPGDDAPVFLVEGEKAADALLRVGKLAVGTVTGASGTPSTEVLSVLGGRSVVLWPDNDDTGREHMARVAKALDGIAAEVMIFAPDDLPPKGDAVEWLQIHQPSELVEAVERLTVAPVPAPDAPATPSSTWQPVDLAAILAGTAPEERPEVLMVDGAALLYRGTVNSLAGEPESMKSWLALEACRQELEDGRLVVYLDFEDSARSVVSRLRALGIPDADIAARFIYVHPGERCTPDALSSLVRLAPGLVILDGVTESMSLEGLELTDNSDVADYYQRLPRVFARGGACVLLLDHVTKSNDERGRWAIGAQGKLAGISGAAYRIAVVEPFGRGRTGKSKLYLTKDRRGWVETSGSDRLACVVEATSENEHVSITLSGPSAESEFRPTCLMTRVSEALEGVFEGLTGRGVEKAVTGKAGAVRLAVRCLLAEGWITESPGPRGAKVYRSSKPYREATDPLAKAGTHSPPKPTLWIPPSHTATASP